MWMNVEHLGKSTFFHIEYPPGQFLFIVKKSIKEATI
jgi:hypothetical protein